jgi:outer membrane receptor protein involved in Fe transport
MKHYLPTLFLLISSIYCLNSQISGKLLDNQKVPIIFANIILQNSADSTIAKVESTDEDGLFNFEGLKAGSYFIEITYLGYESKIIPNLNYKNESIILGNIALANQSVQLETAVVTATRALVEVRADRKIFNVQGTINSAGENGLNLLRKAPGVLVDNNNNISVLGRAGVLVYVDGRRLPLTGSELSNYLQNLTAAQIDRIEIISNPGAKYEAQGNAGIIDIILKKDKNLGANASMSSEISQGRYLNSSLNGSGNYRTKKFNTFVSAGIFGGKNWNLMDFENNQNNLITDEVNISISKYSNYNLRLGTDFFLNSKNTIGFLISGQLPGNTGLNNSQIEISKATPGSKVDSILIANNKSVNDNFQSTYNLNYAYINGDNRFNIDLDYGFYDRESTTYQPNQYYQADRISKLRLIETRFLTPSTISITTAKADYDTPLAGGNLSIGTKFSQVNTDNTFLFYDIQNEIEVQNNRRSNNFIYDEKVYAFYTNYTRAITSKLGFSGGLRLEKTDANGDLNAFSPDLEADPVVFNYWSPFPSFGLKYDESPGNTYSFNYGRRINRPDYNVLNPFREQTSELSFSRGNAFLQPEIVNNLELGYTFLYKYNLTTAYSYTTNQITRLIGPDEFDPRAGYISWDNLANQKIYSVNFSAPSEVTSWWNSYINLSATYTNNQATYPNGSTVDVQAIGYNVYQQQTFSLPKKWKAEISGWYSGPGVWGGVFLHDPSYSLNLGLQRRFLAEKLNAKLSFSDITYQSGWSGVSRFNGLEGSGFGNWDSRRVALSLSYDFGNLNIKSRKRETGIEAESKRAKG